MTYVAIMSWHMTRHERVSLLIPKYHKNPNQKTQKMWIQHGVSYTESHRTKDKNYQSYRNYILPYKSYTDSQIPIPTSYYLVSAWAPDIVPDLELSYPRC